MKNHKYSPRQQWGWFRMRNEMLMEVYRKGMSREELMMKYNLALDTVSTIITAYSEGSNA